MNRLFLCQIPKLIFYTNVKITKYYKPDSCKKNMARKDWISVGIHNDIVEAIDTFLETSDAKNLEIKSRQDFVNSLAKQFLEKYGKSKGKELLKQTKKADLFEIAESKKKR